MSALNNVLGTVVGLLVLLTCKGANAAEPARQYAEFMPCQWPQFDAAVQHFSEILQFHTVGNMSHPERADPVVWDLLDMWMREAYSEVFQAFEVEKVRQGQQLHLKNTIVGIDQSAIAKTPKMGCSTNAVVSFLHAAKWGQCGQCLQLQQPARNQHSHYICSCMYIATCKDVCSCAITNNLPALFLLIQLGRGNLSYLFTWKGDQPDLNPVLFVAHTDVVPVAPETLKVGQHDVQLGKVSVDCLA
jgi:hypothetical protein